MRKKRRTSSRIKRGRLKRTVGVFLALAVLLLLVDLRARPIIKKSGAYQSKIAAELTISEGVYETIETGDYGDFCEIIVAESGGVGYVSVKTAAVNRFKSYITKTLQERLRVMSGDEYGFHLGDLTGFEFLYGQGFKVPIKIYPKGAVKTAIISEFRSAGINQTKHSLWLEVEAEVTAFIPGYSTTGKVNDKYLISETIIAGKVPDAYTYIDNLESTSDPVVGAIKDFGAY